MAAEPHRLETQIESIVAGSGFAPSRVDFGDLGMARVEGAHLVEEA